MNTKETDFNAQEAIMRIEEIHKVIASSNTALFSGPRMIVIGILILLIPGIETLTHGMTFNNQFMEQNGLLIATVHMIFYWALFTGVGKIIPFKKFDRKKLHPLIQKSFGLTRPLMFSLFGMMFAFGAIGDYQFIHPMAFIIMGILFNIWGRFSIPAITYIAWSYLVAGLVYIYLTKFDIPNLWIYFVVYQGLSCILMGILTKNSAKGEPAHAGV